MSRRRGPAWRTWAPVLWRAPIMCALALALTGALPAAARVVEETGKEIVIRGAPGHTTEVAFPEAISQVITSLGKDALSLETAGSRLYLAPLEPKVRGTIFVILESDRSVPLALVPAGAQPADVSVRVVGPAKAAPEGERQQALGLTPLGLMRAMVVGRELRGVTRSQGDGREVYNDQAVRLTLAEVWRAPRLEGDVLLAENLRPIWIRLPLERLHFPGLLAVHAEAETLAPQPGTPEERLARRHLTRLFLIRVP